MAGNANAIRGRDREEISMPPEADESKSEATSTAVSSNRAAIVAFSFVDDRLLISSGPSRTRGHVKTRQHVNQFKAPAEIRRAARPAKLIALRALAPARRGARSFRARSGPGAYLSRLPKCAY